MIKNIRAFLLIVVPLLVCKTTYPATFEFCADSNENSISSSN
jgi:hypothetical protein